LAEKHDVYKMTLWTPSTDWPDSIVWKLSPNIWR